MSIGPNRREVLAGAAASLATGARAARVRRVLMVGNSFTYGNDLPKMLKRLSSGAFHVRAIAVGGHRLADHAVDEATRRTIEVSQHDVLVLQDHSIEPLDVSGRLRSAQAVTELSGLARHRLVMFATWARIAGHPLYAQAEMPSGPSEMTRIVAEHYTRQAGVHGAGVALVGHAWQHAIGLGMRMHAPDGYHANVAGSFLAALVLAQTMGIDVAPDVWQPRDLDPVVALALRAMVTGAERAGSMPAAAG